MTRSRACRAGWATWKTPWRAVRPRLVDLAGDEVRLVGVTTLGIDEHVWHHTPHRGAAKGPTMLTGMVDLTRDADGKVRARLLDFVPGRSDTVFAAWLKDRPECFHDGVQVATLNPFRGYANAIRDGTGRGQSRCWTRSTSLGSPDGRWTRSAVAPSKAPRATAATPRTRSTGSATSCAPARAT